MQRLLISTALLFVLAGAALGQCTRWIYNPYTKKLDCMSSAGSVSAPVTLTGGSDAVQLDLKGYSTQTNPILRVRKSDNTVVFQVNNDGSIQAGSGAGAMTIPTLAADPASLVNGDVWYLTTTNKFRKYENGAAADWGGAGATSYSKDLNIDAPSTVDTNKYQITFPQGITLNRIHCSTDTGTVSINLDVRALATPNTAGTDVLSAALVCDNNTQSSCASGCDVNTITGGTVAAHVPVNLQVTATASSPNVVRIHVEGQ